jgi:hypothetical protein
MNIFRKLKLFTTRRNLANCLMSLFVVGVTLGAGLIFPPAGFITGGIACGIYGYLLGSE